MVLTIVWHYHTIVTGGGITPRVTVKLASGTKVTVEGSEDEVQRIVRDLESQSIKQSNGTRKKTGTKPRTNLAVKDYVLELEEAGFFKKAQRLSDVKNALQAEGHIVPITTLSGVMLALVKSRELRRFRDGKTWKYVVRQGD